MAKSRIHKKYDPIEFWENITNGLACDVLKIY